MPTVREADVGVVHAWSCALPVVKHGSMVIDVSEVSRVTRVFVDKVARV